MSYSIEYETDFTKEIQIGFFQKKNRQFRQLSIFQELILYNTHENKIFFTHPKIWELIKEVGNLQNLVYDSNQRPMLTAICDIQVTINYILSVKDELQEVQTTITNLIGYLELGKYEMKEGEVFFHFYKT